VNGPLPIVIALGGIESPLLARFGIRLGGGRRRVQARITADGVQEAAILVRDGYHPNTIRVLAGCPVRLVFDRQEEDPCSARVFLSEPALSRHLAPFAKTVVTFTPQRMGTHLFTCEEGRFRGHLVVAAPAPKACPLRRGDPR
jgi:plastocyanin domain-containing protein